MKETYTFEQAQKKIEQLLIESIDAPNKKNILKYREKEERTRRRAAVICSIFVCLIHIMMLFILSPTTDSQFSIYLFAGITPLLFLIVYIAIDESVALDNIIEKIVGVTDKNYKIFLEQLHHHNYHSQEDCYDEISQIVRNTDFIIRETKSTEFISVLLNYEVQTKPYGFSVDIVYYDGIDSIEHTPKYKTKTIKFV